jgi:hypothetical protein
VRHTRFTGTSIVATTRLSNEIRKAERETPGALARHETLPPWRTQSCVAGNICVCVRSSCSGVIDTWPFDTAWKSVPSLASRALPEGPIQ